ncbi:2-methylaconitate cis-trans-isomerase PrpF [Pseudomonas marginalis]|nr:2-methylaconitate cis-trans-isomerase PrpF [Pseudomonas marginalis]MCP1525712.1 2-methylaconitate cis-trans-isomerase PrpF [Pseudomonas marginalis]MDQ0498974.1 2-methylaconitate cis-trans-isomerase PrpF [Pseudomonas marginalis]
MERNAVRFGHPSGTLRVGAEATQVNGEWVVKKANTNPLWEGLAPDSGVPVDTFVN